VFVEFGSVYALSWNKVIDCRDRIGRVVRLCKWLTVLVDLLTGCSRRLLLHEYNVYRLICFVESMITHSSHNFYKIGMTGLLGESSEGFRSKPYAPFSHRKLSVWPPWGTMLIGEIDDHSSLRNVIFFSVSHDDLGLDVTIHVNVICFIWLQLQMLFVVSWGASWIILTVLFEDQLSFVPLLNFILWSKQESLFSSFSRGILVEAFWMAEASRKLLLLAWDISLSKMCVKNCVCGRFLALIFTHSVSLTLPSVPWTRRKQLA